MIRKPEDGDGIALTRFIANLDLAFILEVAWPLTCRRIQGTGTPLYDKNVTDHDANVRGRMSAKWCERFRIDESVASTGSSGLERKAKCPIRALEENGQLQFGFLDVISFIGKGMRSPRILRHYSPPIPDATIEHPTGLARQLK